jgi:hypothetical protein
LPSLGCKKKRVVRPLSGWRNNPVTKNKNYKRETMMLNEIKIVEDGVIFELEIEEVEEVVAPTVLINP